jgi:predicted phosphoribosyltransferase
MFKDRIEAGILLGRALACMKLKDPLVLGIPRGGMAVAVEAARQLRCPVDMVLVRRIPLPNDEQSCLGAIDETGQAVWNTPLGEASLPPGWLDGTLQRAARHLRARRAYYDPIHTPVPLSRRDVVVVDDGVHTGATMLAALEAVRRWHPSRLIAAAAVAPLGAERRLDGVADQVLVLLTPGGFRSVAEAFEDYPLVGEEEAAALLRHQHRLIRA